MGPRHGPVDRILVQNDPDPPGPACRIRVYTLEIEEVCGRSEARTLRLTLPGLAYNNRFDQLKD